MGVNGLQTVIDGKKSRSQQGWEKRQVKGKLVVDGNQFCHQACRNVPGGISYIRLFKYITEILRKFSTRWGIEPIFIFDGVDKPRKLTRRHRKTDAGHSSGIPMLAYTVLANALSVMGAKVYEADGEGDDTRAQVAKFLECPVLSSDSDNFLFDIPGGYIHLGNCFKNKLFDSDAPILEAEVFVREEFVNEHFGGNLDLIFLYPAILGNDIYPSTGHLMDRTRDWNAKDVDHLISQSPEIASLPEGVKKNFDDVKDYYNNLNPLDPEKILDMAIPKCPKPVPKWFHKCYRAREITHMLFDALVNGTQHHARSQVSLRIRQCCYKILNVHEVTEYHSTVEGVKEVQVRCLEEDIPGHLSLDDVESDDSRRKDVFYFALNCEEKAIQLDTLSKEERFFMCTVIYWKSSEASPPDFVVKALIACFVRLSNRREREEILPPHCEEKRFHSRNRPPLSDWQCVYQDALSLFLLLRYSRRDAPCPSRIFDKEIALSLASRGYPIDREIPRFLTDRNLQRKYAELLQIVGLGRLSRRASAST